MSPHKVDRLHLARLTDLPNIGPAMAADLQGLGIRHPQQLVGRCPFALYDDLCRQSGQRHDPCVIDVFMSITAFMAGEPAQVWWAFTEQRKQRLAADTYSG